MTNGKDTNCKRYVTYQIFVGTMLTITGAIFVSGWALFSDLKADLRADYAEIKAELRELRDK